MLVFVSLALAGPAEVVTPIEADRRRIQAHLAGVEAALRAVEGEGGPEQRERRSEALDTLHAYRLAGEFPHNTEVPGERVPVFRDADGRDCAVGALVRASGEAALADAVDDRWHLARVHAMDEPALAAWAVDHGFTVDELARIQPSYCMCDTDAGYAPVCGADGVTYWNSCAAEVCAGSEAVSDGPCAYERDVCPDYQAEPAPVVTACDDMNFMCDENGEALPRVYDSTDWTGWLAAQDQACWESVNGDFDGPDDPPAVDEADGEPAAGCAAVGGGTFGGALVGLVIAMGRRRRG